MLYICPGCNRTYASYAKYCNYCEVDLNDTNITTRFVENPNSRRLKLIANCFAAVAIALLTSVFIVLAYIPSWLHRIFYRRSRRKSILPANELMRRNVRQPVLILRSFSRDGAPVAKEKLFYFWELIIPGYSLLGNNATFEERLADIFFHLGPPVAISDPRTHGKLPEIGAARMDVQEGWQTVVEILCRQARYIVVILDATDGVKWEISVAFGARESVRLFIVPPIQGFLSRRTFKKNYSILQRQFSALPEYHPRLVAVLFPVGSTEGRVLLSAKESPAPNERLLKIEEAVLVLSEGMVGAYSSP